MILSLISDIERGSLEMEILEVLGSKFGLFNMTVVLMKVIKLYPIEKEITFEVDEGTYRQTVAIILSMAIMNFASERHEHFFIPVNPDEKMGFSRTISPEGHREEGIRLLTQVHTLIKKFEPSKDK